MRNKKMSIEEFKKIKQKMQELITKIDTDNIDENNSFVQEYIKLQNKLLSHNLSDISFSAWKNLTIINTENYTANFYKTNAKLDFKYLKVIGVAIFHNCQTKNIKYLGKYLNPKSFDKSTIEKNSKTFLPDWISPAFQNIYYNNQLTVSDLNNKLSIEGIKEVYKRDYYNRLNFSDCNKLLFKIKGPEKMRILLEQKYYKTYSFVNSFQIINKLFDCFISKNKLNKTFYSLFKITNEPSLLTDLCLLYIEIYCLNPNYDYISGFLEYSKEFKKMCDIIGIDNLKILIKKHFGVFKHLIAIDRLDILTFYLKPSINYEDAFISAVKDYWTIYEKTHEVFKKEDFPKWMNSINIEVIEGFENWDEMKEYKANDYILNDMQRTFIRIFGFENIKRFEDETHFFTKSTPIFFENLEYIHDFFNIYFKEMNTNIMTYEDFENEMAKLIDYIRRKFSPVHTFHYDFIEGSFRDNHPEIFMDKSAPEELKLLFYKNCLDLDYLRNNPNIIPYLMDKDLNTLFSKKFNIFKKRENNQLKLVNFIDYYIEKFGKKELLELLAKYGELCTNANDDWITYPKINGNETKETIEIKLQQYIFERIQITSETTSYHYLENTDFAKNYPELFIDLSNIAELDNNTKARLLNKFYTKTLTYQDVKEYPILQQVLLHKNLNVVFNLYYVKEDPLSNGYKYLKELGNEKFLELCKIYGDYFKKSYCYRSYRFSYLNNFDLSKNEIEKIILSLCLNGDICYLKETAPDFLIKEHPELFLSDDAPEDLKILFYGKNEREISFTALKEHPEWLPYLEGKQIRTPFLRTAKDLSDELELKTYFDTFGDKAVKLGMQKPETVKKMIYAKQVYKMKDWYDKTGGKFIPDYVVMLNFPLEEADKFLNNINYWTRLMKIESYAKTEESREAILKLAYSFGVFHNDQEAFQKLYILLTDIPHHIDTKDSVYNWLAYLRLQTTANYDKVLEIKNTLIKEGFNYNEDPNEPLIWQIYRENKDNSVTLTINPQQYPKSVQLIRELTYLYNDYPIISPNMAHQLFGGFKFEYDKDFREFLLNNLEEICKNTYISNIQRQFKEIKTFNSNRVLTLELAIDFIQTKKFENVEVGNEKMAEITANVGYSQSDFDTLQKIYNYGKTRTFSSIPRIVNKIDKYEYEILRLDDPLALAIGDLTDCCQRLSNAAETCMIHSMVDKNGRVFVIRDNEGNIISQSWVWRNKNVLCFDNIEVPNKVFQRTKSTSLLRKKNLTNEILEIYKKAAKELMEEDKKIYQELLKQGKITQKQYDNLLLSKVTVGLGYNDIANAIIRNTKEDKNILRPLPIDVPFSLRRVLYTNDSQKQYILEEKDFNISPSNYNNLYVHSDLFQIYDDSNMTYKELIVLQNLENISKHNNYLIENLEIVNKNIVSQIASLYNLNKESTKIIIHSNFAIIFDETDNDIIIGDLLFNTELLNSEYEINLITQIHLALNQIKNNKNISFKNLNSLQESIVEKASNLDNDIFNEFNNTKR